MKNGRLSKIGALNFVPQFKPHKLRLFPTCQRDESPWNPNGKPFQNQNQKLKIKSCLAEVRNSLTAAPWASIKGQVP